MPWLGWPRVLIGGNISRRAVSGFGREFWAMIDPSEYRVNRPMEFCDAPTDDDD